MRRLASYTVRSGLVVAWFLAASPIRRSVSVKATYEGVMRLPWSLAMISTRPFLYTPTHESACKSCTGCQVGDTIVLDIGMNKETMAQVLTRDDHMASCSLCARDGGDAHVVPRSMPMTVPRSGFASSAARHSVPSASATAAEDITQIVRLLHYVIRVV